MGSEQYGPPESTWGVINHALLSIFDFIMQYGAFGVFLLASVALNWWLLREFFKTIKELMVLLGEVKAALHD